MVTHTNIMVTGHGSILIIMKPTVMNMVKKFGNGLVNKLNKMNIKDVTDKFLNVTSFNYNFQLS